MIRERGVLAQLWLPVQIHCICFRLNKTAVVVARGCVCVCVCVWRWWWCGVWGGTKRIYICRVSFENVNELKEREGEREREEPNKCFA